MKTTKNIKFRTHCDSLEMMSSKPKLLLSLYRKKKEKKRNDIKYFERLLQ